MTLSTLIEAFLAERSRAGCRDSTLRIYRARLKTIRGRLGERPAGEISRSDWLEVLAAAALKADGSRLAPDTIALTLTLVTSLQTFGLEEEAITAPWLKAKDLKKPSGRRRERTATAEETARLIAAMTPAYRRLYETLRHTGARRSELCRARIRHLQGSPPSRRIVLAEHKTSRADGKPRVIHLGHEADQLVSEALEWCPPATDPPPWATCPDRNIFLDEAGRPWHEDRVTRTFVRIRRRLGLPEDLKLHSTRHEFASRVTQKHGLKAAKDLCGHKSLKTTEKYAHLQADYLADCATGLYTPDADAA